MKRLLKAAMFLPIVVGILAGCDDTKKITDIPGAAAKKTIGDIGDKESVWCEPWVMWVDSGGDCYINEKNTFSSTRQHPDWIKITKAGSKYNVDLCGSTAKWEKLTVTGSTNIGPECRAVAEFKNSPTTDVSVEK